MCMSVFGVIFVDTANIYSEVVRQSEVEEIPYAFFTYIAHEMIFNGIDRPSLQIILVILVLVHHHKILWP